MAVIGPGKRIIVMGVSGSGKSAVGLAVAKKLGIKFIDGDDLHPRANILKMAGGEPLNDADRTPWLERIRDAVFSLEQKQESGVIVCSALKKAYRDEIRHGNHAVQFVFLDGDRDLLVSRMNNRQGHFMRTSMLDSQLATLEVPTADEKDVIRVDIRPGLELVVARVLAAIR